MIIHIDNPNQGKQGFFQGWGGGGEGVVKWGQGREYRAKRGSGKKSSITGGDK